MYDRYEVRGNYCNCHPEDCSCDDWAIFKNGEKWATIFDKGNAEHIVRALNIVEQIEDAYGEHVERSLLTNVLSSSITHRKERPR